MNIGERLKIYRKYKKLTQEALADKAGINDKYYGKIERDESSPTIDVLEKLSLALDIDCAELFLFGISNNSQFVINQEIGSTIVTGLKNDFDIHFNRSILLNECNSSLWYSGYVGSMNFDEFEMKIYATGNIKGVLYIDGKEILEINNNDISNELKKYISNDETLKQYIEYMQFNEEILREKNGNVFFIYETNWLSAKVINNISDEEVITDIILDTDNIIEVFRNREVMFDYIFGK